MPFTSSFSQEFNTNIKTTPEILLTWSYVSFLLTIQMVKYPILETIPTFVSTKKKRE